MPIVFVLCGVLFFLILFKFINIKLLFNRLVVCSILFLVCASYFCDNIFIYDVYFNCVQLFLILMILLFVLIVSKSKIKPICLSLFMVIFYYFVANGVKENFDNSIQLQEYIFLIPILASCIFLRFSDGALCCLLACMGIVIANVFFEFDLYTFATVDFDMILSAFAIYILLCVNKFLIFNNLSFMEEKKYAFS